MSAPHLHPYDDQFVRDLVRRKARQLARRATDPTQDLEELEQELLARVLAGLTSYDPVRGHLYPFATVVAERASATIANRSVAARRRRRPTLSLSFSIKVGDEDSAELAQVISQKDLDARLGKRTRSDRDLFEEREDVNAVCATLPEILRVVARGLSSKNASELARELGLPRSTIQSCIGTILRRFEQAGLRDYLPK